MVRGRRVVILPHHKWLPLYFYPQNDMPPPLIAGSVGPYGACQHDRSEYTGTYVDHMTEQVCHMTECVHV